MANSGGTSSNDFIAGRYGKCFFCEGFYEPNHGRPVCATCHMFLFPHGIQQPLLSVYVDTSDDRESDSGNEDNDVSTQQVANCSRKVFASRLDELSRWTKSDRWRQPPDMMQNMPTEVLMVLFNYLIDSPIAMSAARSTCQRWSSIIDSQIPEVIWRGYVRRYWPLFEAHFAVQDWRKLYLRLEASAPCLRCLDSMMSIIDEAANCRRRGDQDGVTRGTAAGAQADSDFGSISLFKDQRLKFELRAMLQEPVPGIHATPLDHRLCHWHAYITGPPSSPYEGGIFYIYLNMPDTYPINPPVVRFITKIFHPNISRHGDVSLDLILHNWTLALTLSKVLISIQSLLTDPYCNGCMEQQIGELYMKDRAKFDDIARRWTWKFALHDYVDV